jgi:hypothetical protein
LAVLGVLAVTTMGTAATAEASDAAKASPIINPETGGYLAEYNGQTIDLSQDWEGADICAEQMDGSFTCYDNEADYRAAEGISATGSGNEPFDSADCPSGYFCFWEKELFEGQRVQFRSAGDHSLSGTGLYKEASSFYNRRLASGYMTDGSCNHAFGDSASNNAYEGILRHVEGCGGRSWNDRATSVYLAPTQ